MIDQLRREAETLEALARELVALRRDETGGASEKAANDLGHATVRFSIALDDLADRSLALSRDTDPDDRPGDPDPLAWERATLALLSATLAGDVALDALAWAELTRRGKPPREDPRSGRIPTLWPELMKAIDDEPAEPMTRHARFLDVTLDAARDAIVAHRNPHLWDVRMSGTGAPFRLDLITLERPRLVRAIRRLRGIQPSIGRPPFRPRMDDATLRWMFEQDVERLVYMAPSLGPNERKRLRECYRIAGISSPDLANLAGAFAALVGIYLERRREG